MAAVILLGQARPNVKLQSQSSKVLFYFIQFLMNSHKEFLMISFFSFSKQLVA